MKFILALFKHAVLVMQLEHDGSGLPVKFSGAFLLAACYATLIFANSAHFSDELLGLSFVVCVYLFILRLQVVGLVILIGIISSFITLVLSLFGEVSVLQMVMLNAMEYLMVFGALINTIKRNAKIN